MRDALKLTAHVLATIVVSPALLSYYVRARVLGPDRALEGSTQALAWLPGLFGVYLRRAFLTWTISSCDRRASVHFGTLFSQTGARLDANVYVGPNCHLGLVHLERDVLLAAGVHVPSGARTHGTDDIDAPIREQDASRSLVRIGEGSWIGSGAVVLADVGKHSVVGAGSVVTKPIPDFVVAAGVPARVIRSRIEASARDPQG
jgi:acetyltransferase-like isoleucine patch superfamily enzyme